MEKKVKKIILQLNKDIAFLFELSFINYHSTIYHTQPKRIRLIDFLKNLARSPKYSRKCQFSEMSNQFNQ